MGRSNSRYRDHLQAHGLGDSSERLRMPTIAIVLEFVRHELQLYGSFAVSPGTFLMSVARAFG